MIIDGYNFICAAKGISGSHPGGMDLEEERELLLERLNIYKKIRGGKITVVFDGTRSGNLSRNTMKKGSVGLVFSRGGEEADTVIKEMARKGGGLTIVTSDRELGDQCSSFGAIIIRAGEFYDSLEAALYEDIKGVNEDDEDGGPRGWGEKKGPARKLSKKERQKRTRLKKM